MSLSQALNQFAQNLGRYLGSRNEIRCSPACRNNLFHVQLPSVRSRGRFTRKKLSSLWLDYRLAFV